MKFTGSRKSIAAALAVGVIVGGGLTVVAPAVASQDASYAATNWKKIWKKHLRKLADKRYYTKAQSDAKYSTKTETAGALANYYTKAQSDAGYATKGSSYTKAESDAKYAAKLPLIRGTVMLVDTAAAASNAAGAEISYGVTLAAAPTVHYIPVSGAVPAGCSGDAQSPNASEGHLCVFAGAEINAGSTGIFNITGGGGSNTMGAVLVSRSAGVGEMIVAGSWALRPGALAVVTSNDVAPKVSKGNFGR